MTAILAILGAIVGGLVGAVTAFFGYSVIAELIGVPDFEGARSVGAALVIAPVGAIVGAILGCFAVLRLRREKTGGLLSQQGLIAAGVVLASVAGLYLYFFWQPPAPLFSALRPKPVLNYEIRVPAKQIDAENIEDIKVVLRTHRAFLVQNGKVEHYTEGDNVVLSAQHTMYYRVSDRALEMWLAPEKLLIFNLPIPEIPEPSDTYSDWRRVDHVRRHYHGEDIEVAGGYDIFIRTKVRWDN